MDGPTDELLTRVLRSAAELSERSAGRLIGEARAEAEAEVKAILKSAMKAAMLTRAAAALESVDPTSAAAPTAATSRAPAERPAPARQVVYVYAITRSSSDDVSRLDPV